MPFFLRTCCKNRLSHREDIAREENVSWHRRRHLGAARWQRRGMVECRQVWLRLSKRRSHTPGARATKRRSLAMSWALQTSTRGFVLTGSDRMLAPYNTGTIRLDKCPAPAPPAHCRQSSPNSKLRGCSSRPSWNFARSWRRGWLPDGPGDWISAVDTESFLRGQSAIDRIHSIIDLMVAEENRLLRMRIGATQSAAPRVPTWQR